MAFQTPAAIQVSFCHGIRYREHVLLTIAQSAVSASAELWPTMSAVLKSPWQGFSRQSSTGGAQQVQVAGSKERSLTPKTQVRRIQIILGGFG